MTPGLRELQQAFARAVFEDDAALYPHIRDCRFDDGNESRAAVQGRTGCGFGAERNLRVYQHNTSANLTDALAAVYPVVKRLVGDGFFDFSADRYWHAHPPISGNIHDFGDSFPDFLAGFEPARTLAYLPDVARLEWAWHRAFHAPDPEPMDRQQLADIDPAEYGNLRFRLHPSVCLIKSVWPVLRIWEAHQQPGEPNLIDIDQGGETTMVIRRGLEVVVERLPPGEYAFLESLARSEPMASACEAALIADMTTDIPALLNRAVEQKTLVGLVRL
ncbi:MAG: DNA-binding domain-containing protein [Pseudomonadota bacterium]